MLKRNLNLISNFGVAFSNISILTGISSLFQYGLMTGGPVIMLWSWPIVTLFTLMIGLCLAEICSSYPHSGGVYYWSFHLCKSSQHAAFWSWMTAWLNICATISMIAAVDFACSTTIGSILYLIWEITCTPFEIYVMFVLIVILQAILNSLKGKTLHILGKLSIFWHAIGTLIIIICILKGKDNHSFVLNDFVNLTGWNNSIYVALLGGLMAQFTMTGYDGSAHVSEETMDPHRSAPKGIIYSILISFVVGWAYMFALLFAISDYTAIVNDPFPISQIFLFTTGKIGAVLCSLIFEH